MQFVPNVAQDVPMFQCSKIGRTVSATERILHNKHLSIIIVNIHSERDGRLQYRSLYTINFIFVAKIAIRLSSTNIYICNYHFLYIIVQYTYGSTCVKALQNDR